MKSNDSSWKVAFIGECMVELQKTPQGVINQTFGGDTFNTAAYLSRIGQPLGIGASYISALGDDSFSHAMREFWNAENVESSLTRSMPGRRPGLYFITLDAAGERTFTYWRGEAAVRDTFEGKEGDALLARLADFNAIYLSGISLAVLRETGRNKLLERLQKLQAAGVQVVFDCNFRPALWAGAKTAEETAYPWYARIIACSNIVFISRDEVRVLSLAHNAPAEAVCAFVASLGAQEVVLKDGGGDCAIFTQETLEIVPACKLETVVDTTAAGDSFAAAYIASRYAGLTPRASATCAHMLAAGVVSHRGAVIPKDIMFNIFPGIIR